MGRLGLGRREERRDLEVDRAVRGLDEEGVAVARDAAARAHPVDLDVDRESVARAHHGHARVADVDRAVAPVRVGDLDRAAAVAQR